MDMPKEKKSSKESNDKSGARGDTDDYLKSCPNEQDNIQCTALEYPCMLCNRTIDCIYGGLSNFSCEVKAKVHCNVSNSKINPFHYKSLQNYCL